jgi:hypothetical protein
MDMIATAREATASGDRQATFESLIVNRWWLLGVALVTAALCLPFLRAIFWLGDEGILLHGAARMLDGQRLYSDFFEFLPPGGFVLMAIWFKAAGVSFLSARFFAVLTITATACLTFLTCYRVSRDAPLSALFTVGWVVMSQGQWTEVSHHWFSTLFSVVAAWAAFIAVEYRRPSFRWPLLSGAAAGMAAAITPTAGASVAAAALLAYLRPRTHPAALIIYLGGCALAPIVLVAYLIWSGVFAQAFYDVILWPIQHYSSINRVPFGFFHGHQNYPLEFLFPAAGLLAVVVCILDWSTTRSDPRLWLCVALAVAAFIGCFPRADIFHIAFVTPLVLPLVLFGINRLTRTWRPGFRWAAVGILVASCVPAARSFGSIAKEAMFESPSVATTRGAIAAVELPGLPDMLQRIEATPPTDAFFFYPDMPMMPFLTARNHVSRINIFTPEYTLPTQYKEACVSVMREAAWVIVDRKWTDPVFLKASYLSMQNAQPPEVLKFEQALDNGFEPVGEYGSFIFKHRRSNRVDTSLCIGIDE